MINFLIGPPGGGKSYEAVVFHVLPTIEQGRKVITNLPLNMEELTKIEPRAPQLVELRTVSRKPGAVPFSDVLDYGDDWRDKATGQGALYVIDECHKALPRGETTRTVEEWYAEHRHEGCDLLLMTQSYGKISKAICDQVQVCYRVKKMTTFGKPTEYIRKVQDGVRGDVMSTTTRVYEKRFYKLYKSHTRTISAVMEADAKDISPAFLKWRRASYAVLALGAVWVGFNGYRHFTKETPPPVDAKRAHEGARGASTVAAAPPAGPQPSKNMRLTGVLLLGPALSRVSVYVDGEGERSYPLGGCERTNITGWKCLIEGQVVTFITGRAPPHADSGGMLAGVGGLLASSSP